MSQTFEFKSGAEVVVPPEAMLTVFTSRHASQFPATPKVILVARRANGTAEFARRGNSGEPNRTWGCHLFVPAEIKAGSTIEIEWTDKKETVLEGGKKKTTYSAAAKLVTG